MENDKARRRRLAALPFAEKLKILEKLRGRSRAIAASGWRAKAPDAVPRSKTIMTNEQDRIE